MGEKKSLSETPSPSRLPGVALRIPSIAVCLLALLACREQERVARLDSTAARAVDTTPSAAYEDGSALRNMGYEPTISPKGDTIQIQGGMMMDKTVAPNYGIEHYTVNWTHYVRILQTTGATSSGEPVRTTRARVRLPASDSTEEVSIWGLCSVNGNNDPLVIGIIRPVVDSAEWQASRAWRFDLTASTLREIPTAGVKCGTLKGED